VLAASVALVGAVAGCTASGSDARRDPSTSTSRPGGATRPTGPTTSTGSDEVVWQQLLTSDVAGALEPVPLVTIYDDGRIFTTESGGGFVTALDLGTVPPAELEQFLADAAASGLFDPGADFGSTGRASSVGLAVSARIDGVTRTASVTDPDLAEVTPGGELTEAQAGRRRDLLALTERARDLAEGSAPWPPDRIVARAAPDADAGSLAPGLTDQLEPRPWPGPPFDTFADVGADWGACLVIGGEEAAAVVRSAEANVTGFYRDGDQIWQILVQPLLPGQEGCPPS
jgi:hypothetical protein